MLITTWLKTKTKSVSEISMQRQTTIIHELLHYIIFFISTQRCIRLTLNRVNKPNTSFCWLMTKKTMDLLRLILSSYGNGNSNPNKHNKAAPLLLYYFVTATFPVSIMYAKHDNLEGKFHKCVLFLFYHFTLIFIRQMLSIQKALKTAQIVKLGKVCLIHWITLSFIFFSVPLLEQDRKKIQETWKRKSSTL